MFNIKEAPYPLSAVYAILGETFEPQVADFRVMQRGQNI